MSNSNRKSLTCQEWQLREALPVQEVLDNPVQYMERFTDAELDVLNYFLVWGNSYKDIYFSQSTIARSLGFSRGFVNRTIQLFKEAGLIVSNYRHKRSCQYKISSWFKDQSIREKLVGVFRAFVWFPLALLSFTITGSVTQKDKSFSKYNQVSSPYREISDNIAGLAQELLAMMNPFQEKTNPIPQSILNLKETELKLSRWGQIKLTCFPDAAINACAEQIKFAPKTQDKFRWFFALCQKWCDDNQIRPNYQKAELIAKNCHMPSYANMLLSPQNVRSKTYVPSVKELLHNPEFGKSPEQKKYAHFAKENNQRIANEKKYRESYKKRQDSALLAAMTQEEAQAHAAKCVAINPVFGEFTAKAILAQWAQLQKDKTCI